MKFNCTCGNVINTTDGFCRGACVLHTQSEYILWIRFICDLIPMKEHPGFKRAFFCDECKRYSVPHGEDLYVFKPCPYETPLPIDFEAYHLLDEYECEEIASAYDDLIKRNEPIEFDINSLPQTRMMSISFAEQKAYIENLDESIETYIIDRVIKNIQ